MSKLIAHCSKKANALLQEYNALQVDQHQVTSTDVFNLHSSFWCSDHTYSASGDTIHQIPLVQRRRVIELYDIQLRCTEELQLCIADMLNLYSFYSATLTTLHSKMLFVLDGHANISRCSKYDQQLYIHLSKYTNVFPRYVAGMIASSIKLAEYTYHRLHRIMDVTQELAASYWATDSVERKKHLQSAVRCSKLIIHPRIEYLFVSEDHAVSSFIGAGSELGVDSHSSLQSVTDTSSLDNESDAAESISS